MAIDRVSIITEALTGHEVSVWRVTRYANDTGTCLWCSTGALVMVPDDHALDWYCQATGAEELSTRLQPTVATALAAAREQAEVVDAATQTAIDALSPAARSLLRLAEDLRREGYDDGLAITRRLFATIVRGRFGTLPPPVEQRIATADFAQLERWSERIAKAATPFLVVV